RGARPRSGAGGSAWTPSSYGDPAFGERAPDDRTVPAPIQTRVRRGDVRRDAREGDARAASHAPRGGQQPGEIGGCLAERLGESVGILLVRGRELAADGRMSPGGRVRRAIGELFRNEPASDQPGLVDLDQD